MKSFIFLLCIVLLVACNKPSPNTLIVGTIAGPETELLETAKQVAETEYGLKIKIVEFNDYNLPNEALQDGSLDANVYQHLPYLEASMHAHGYDLKMIGKTFVYPMAIYAVHHKSLTDIPDHGIIAIPNDPSNETRALLLLKEAGLLELSQTQGNDVPAITSNPKHLVIKEMDAAQLPRVLPDVAAAVINTTFALPAGLNPQTNALFTEGKDSLYANIIVIKRTTTKLKQLELLVKALHSPEVKTKAQQLFGNAAIPAW